MRSCGKFSFAAFPVTLVFANVFVTGIEMTSHVLFAGEGFVAALEGASPGAFIFVGAEVHFETTWTIISSRTSLVCTRVVPKTIGFTGRSGGACLGQDRLCIVLIVCSNILFMV
jgi:hypothetical protein